MLGLLLRGLGIGLSLLGRLCRGRGFGLWLLLLGSRGFLPARRFGGFTGVLAFPCIVIGLLASPLCGAALTFFAAAKKVSKESGLQPLACRCPSLSVTGSG